MSNPSEVYDEQPETNRPRLTEKVTEWLDGSVKRRNVLGPYTMLALGIVAGFFFTARSNDRAVGAVDDNRVESAVAIAKASCQNSNDFRSYNQDRLDAAAAREPVDVVALGPYDELDESVRVYVDIIGAALEQDRLQDIADADAYRTQFPIRDCSLITVPPSGG